MKKLFLKTFAVLFVVSFSFGVLQSPAANPAPPPTKDKTQTIVLAGGCFWGMQAVFQHLKGVKEATAGYAGGLAGTANYNTVSLGMSGHVEAVQVVYDPAQITLDKILKVFFTVAHDPTEVNRQGPDWGVQYRSVVFFDTPEEEKAIRDYIAHLQEAKLFVKPIATTVEPLKPLLKKFYPAEAYHQNYVAQHPDERYVVTNDLPKIAALKKQFPDLYVEK